MNQQKWKFSHLPKWEEIDEPIYFPYAEKFLAKFPWLAVRVFYVLIKIKKAVK